MKAVLRPINGPLRRAYLFRLDDACPTMRRERWNEIERYFDDFGVKPIVGVIPDCSDPALDFDDPDPAFWQRVRGWERKGWAIALHGMHHVYHRAMRCSAPLPALHERSEFTGLPLDEQRRLLRAAWEIFLAHDVRPTLFMAPSHTFDRATLEALRLETGIRVVTDGLALAPFAEGGMQWLPQQLGRVRRMPFGLWTFGLHPSTMSDTELADVQRALEMGFPGIVDVDTALGWVRPSRSVGDRLFAIAWNALRGVRRVLKESQAGRLGPTSPR